MKEIKAFIQPFMLSKVVRVLQQIEGLPGCTVSEVTGFGRGRAGSEKRKVVIDEIGYAEKTKIEIVVQDELVEEVLKCIQENAHTGNKGDGKIFVIECVDVVRIRTGERGKAAI